MTAYWWGEEGIPLALLLLLTVAWRLRTVVPIFRRPCDPVLAGAGPKPPLFSGRRTLAVLGSGGHTSEMLSLLRASRAVFPASKEENGPAAVRDEASQTAAGTGRTREKRRASTSRAPRRRGDAGKADDARGECPSSDLVFLAATSDGMSLRRAAEVVGPDRKPCDVLTVPRARAVGQSFITSVGTTLRASVSTAAAVWRARPDLVLLNGPGTCVPVAAVTLCLRVFGLSGAKVVFVESFARVRTLSLSGRILYPFVDLFVVQWDPVHKIYPRTLLCPSIVS